MLRWMLLLFGLSCWIQFAEADDAAATGHFEGRVLYEADPAKPWRFGRFYVEGKGSGPLIETVVALHGTGLKQVRANSEPVTIEVDQKDFMFKPETTAIRAGDSVKFLNNDGPTHNVRAVHPVASFNENMPAGGEFLYQFKKPTGANSPITLGCVYHGNMRAWIFVFDNPFFKVTQDKEGGKFRFEGIPPGKYRLDVVHPAGRLRSSEMIEIRANETLKKDVVLSPKHVEMP